MKLEPGALERNLNLTVALWLPVSTGLSGRLVILVWGATPLIFATFWAVSRDTQTVPFGPTVR